MLVLVKVCNHLRPALEARVASGSYATVYRAVDATDGTVYAAKILTEVATPEAESRFRAEYEMLRRFSHPAIVRGHAVGGLRRGGRAVGRRAGGPQGRPVGQGRPRPSGRRRRRGQQARRRGCQGRGQATGGQGGG